MTCVVVECSDCCGILLYVRTPMPTVTVSIAYHIQSYTWGRMFTYCTLFHTAMMVFHDHLDTRGVIGIVVALAGAYLYRESRAGHERNPDSYQDEEEKGPLLFEAKARSNITNREKDQDFDSRYPEVQLTAIS